MKKINKFNVVIAVCAVFVGVSHAQAFDFFGSKKDELPLREGFTCCNLPYEDDWISDSNFGALPFIPAGSRIKLKSYGRHRLPPPITNTSHGCSVDWGRIGCGMRLSLIGYSPGWEQHSNKA